MIAPRRLTAELFVDGTAVSGVVIDDNGREQAFRGWLELIALLRGNQGDEDDTATTGQTP